MSAEQSIVAAKASVMIYDGTNKKWVPSGLGGQPTLSEVHIYHHPSNNAFRVVGRKLQDHEEVINCAILRNLKYNPATPTFHQWRDQRQVYGLNFTCKEDADNFASAMKTTLDTLQMPSPTEATDCAICMTNPRDSLLCPCHHMVTCNECAQMLHNRGDCCPICRKKISSFIHVQQA